MGTSSSSTSVPERAASGIILPFYDRAPDLVLRAIQNASSVVPGATDDAGEYMAMFSGVSTHPTLIYFVGGEAPCAWGWVEMGCALGRVFF